MAQSNIFGETLFSLWEKQARRETSSTIIDWNQHDTLRRIDCWQRKSVMEIKRTLNSFLRGDMYRVRLDFQTIIPIIGGCDIADYFIAVIYRL